MFSHQEERKGVQRKAGAVEPETIKPALYVLERIYHSRPCELLFKGGIAIRSKALPDDDPLLIRYKGRGLGIVLDEPVRAESHHYRRDPFLFIQLDEAHYRRGREGMATNQNEYPPPAILPHDPLHFPNPICQNPAKRARERRAAEEERDPELALPPLVPHGEVVNHAGEQPALCDTEEEPRDEEAGQVLDDAHQGRNDSPCYRQRREPYSRRRLLEYNVARDLWTASVPPVSELWETGTRV